jgi:hypothetical protein
MHYIVYKEKKIMEYIEHLKKKKKRLICHHTINIFLKKIHDLL